MSRLALPTCVGLALTFTLVGCSPDPRKSGDTIPVKGTVNLDGKPMPAGEIWFIAPGEPPTTMPIKDGAFSGKAPVGNNKVEVHLFKDGPPLSTEPNGPATKIETLPSRYHGVETTLTADVKAGGANTFTFDVKSN